MGPPDVTVADDSSIEAILEASICPASCYLRPSPVCCTVTSSIMNPLLLGMPTLFGMLSTLDECNAVVATLTTTASP